MTTGFPHRFRRGKARCGRESRQSLNIRALRVDNRGMRPVKRDKPARSDESAARKSAAGRGERKQGAKATSRYRGVSWHTQSGTWRVQLTVSGKHHYVGSFQDETEAARAYDEAARKFHGDSARLNFPTADDEKRSAAPPGTIGRHEAMRRFGVGLKTWQRWEREGVITCGRIVYPPSGGRLKVYPEKEIERMIRTFGRLRPPYPDPNRPGCYRVPLTGYDIKRREVIIDAASLPIVEGREWCWNEGSTEGKGMVVLARFRAATPLRRFIMGITNEPSGEVQVGHVNGDPLDCRRENLVLRDITERLASARKRKTHHGKPCTSRFKGVCWCSHNERWLVQIRAHGKAHRLGFFDDEVSAARAYDDAARELLGEHAWLNFPDTDAKSWRSRAVA